MSDGEAASGKNDSQFIHGKLKTTSARVFACILALCGALVVSIQVRRSIIRLHCCNANGFEIILVIDSKQS